MSPLRLSRWLAPLSLLAAVAGAGIAPAAEAPRAAINPLAVQGPVAAEYAVQSAALVPSFGAQPIDRDRRDGRGRRPRRGGPAAALRGAAAGGSDAR